MNRFLFVFTCMLCCWTELALAQDKIYWTELGNNRIGRSNSDGSGREVGFIDGLAMPLGLALDLESEILYWTEDETNQIKRASLSNPSNVESLNISVEIQVPSGLALDIENGKIYWTDRGTGEINRANIDGSEAETLVEGLDQPSDIVLDTRNGKIYWTELGNNRIGRINLDRSSREEAFIDGLDMPLGLVLDVRNGNIYWTEDGSNLIKRASLNNPSNVDILDLRPSVTVEVPSGLALDIENGKIYWTDRGTGEINRANIDGSEAETLVEGLDQPSDIVLDIENDVLFEEVVPTNLDGGTRGVKWGDYNQDGFLDVAISGEQRNGGVSTSVYRNEQGTGSFTLILNIINLEGALAWGDYDNDGDLDLVIAGNMGSERVTRLYRNSNNDQFVEVTDAGMPSMEGHHVSWADYDNDGDLDLSINGINASNQPQSLLFNNIDGIFSEDDVGLPQASNGTITWGDYDQDGDLDIFHSGALAPGRTCGIYNNEGGNFTHRVGCAVFVVENGLFSNDAAWGDYDDDGDLDLLFSGQAGSNWQAKVFRNDGLDVFVDTSSDLLGLSQGSASWGDIDNDGDLDIMLTGITAPKEGTTHIYKNDNGVFSLLGTRLPNLYNGRSALGDFDNDGDLDTIIIGRDNSNSPPRVVLFRNASDQVNVVPNPPNNLDAIVSEESVIFQWTASTDDKTPSLGLSYNLRVGTQPGSSDVMTPMSVAESGQRLVPALGNAEQNLTWRLNNLPLGTYYWSIQAIDHSWGGSVFSTEATFTVSPDPQPPSASFTTTPTVGELPLMVNFDASASNDPDGIISSYAWDFGNGSNGSGEMTSHMYSNAGSYTVTLTVTDNDGLTGQSTRIVTVTAPPFSATGANGGVGFHGQLIGWACNQARPNSSTNVVFYGNGPAGSDGLVLGDTLTIFESEDNINAACGGGNTHRYRFAIPPEKIVELGTDPFTVYAYARDVHTGTLTLLDLSPQTIHIIDLDPRPVGILDSLIINGQLAGWACDTNNSDSSIVVRFYNDQNGSLNLINETVADADSGPDIADRCGGGNNHRFFYRFTATDLLQINSDPFTIDVFGVDPITGRENRLFGSPKTIIRFELNQRPTGVLEEISVDGLIEGWACDRDDPPASISVRLTGLGLSGIEHELAVIVADLASQQGVADECNGGFNHRFSYMLTEEDLNWLGIGTVEIRAYAIDPVYNIVQQQLHGSPRTYVIIGDVSEENESELPTEYALLPSFPNPFNNITRLTFTLPQAESIRLSVYDVQGRLITVITEGRYSSGVHSILFNAQYLPNGVYIAVFQTPKTNFIQRIVQLK